MRFSGRVNGYGGGRSTFGEVLAQRAAAKVDLFVTDEGQQLLIDRLWDREVIGATQRSLFSRSGTLPSKKSRPTSVAGQV